MAGPERKTVRPSPQGRIALSSLQTGLFDINPIGNTKSTATKRRVHDHHFAVKQRTWQRYLSSTLAALSWTLIFRRFRHIKSRLKVPVRPGAVLGGLQFERPRQCDTTTGTRDIRGMDWGVQPARSRTTPPLAKEREETLSGVQVRIALRRTLRDGTRALTRRWLEPVEVWVLGCRHPGQTRSTINCFWRLGIGVAFV